MPKFIRFIKVGGVVVGEIVVEADAVEEEDDDQLIATKSGAVVATFVKRSVQSWSIIDSPRELRRSSVGCIKQPDDLSK